MTEEKPKRGRPASTVKLTDEEKRRANTERQRQRRRVQKQETFETFPAMAIGMTLSAEASQALQMLVYARRKAGGKVTLKAVIESVLIEAYAKT